MPTRIDRLPATALTDAEIASEIARLEAIWDRFRNEEDGHGGSPGEWVWERLGELDTEQSRRQ